MPTWTETIRKMTMEERRDERREMFTARRVRGEGRGRKCWYVGRCGHGERMFVWAMMLSVSGVKDA